MTVSDLKQSSARVAAALNICPDDERFLSYLNDAEERMSNAGRYYGSIQEVQFCLTNEACFVLPREIATLERIAVDGQPVPIQNGWYSFTRQIACVPLCSSCGRANCECWPQMRIREGNQASFSRTNGANKLLRSYPTDTEDVGKKLVFQGYDYNNIWVKTEDSTGQLIDGEEVTLAFPFVDTDTVWGNGSPVAVKKEVTRRRVLVYEYDTTTGVELPIADYEPGETRPSYQVAYLPGGAGGSAWGAGNCCGVGPTCTSGTVRRTLTALANLQHTPLISDGDWLMFQNLSAYKAAMIAVKAYEDGDVVKGNYYFYGTQAASKNGRGVDRIINRDGAIPLLQAELRKMTADRTNAYINVDQTNRLAGMMLGFR